jgi:thiol-disulfide isomerase/thioredoxin
MTDPERPDVHEAHEAHEAHGARPRASGSTKALVGVLLAGTAGMIIFLFVHLSSDGGIRPGVNRAHAGCTKGQRDCLPEVTYIDTMGTAYTRESLAGKVVLVNFWATWCKPCEKEIPDLSRAYEKYKSKGVVFLGVMSDNPAPDPNTLLNFQSDHDMTYPVVRSNYELMSAFHSPESLPTTFVYDRSGKQVFNRVGLLRESDLDSLLAPLVAQ